MTTDRYIGFFDVETTGLTKRDRIVSLGLIVVQEAEFTNGIFNPSIMNLVFNPDISCHPKAAKVHGFSDWALEHQERFRKYGELIHRIMSSLDLLVAHNIEFDYDFINREFRRHDLPEINVPTYCTMNGWARLHDKYSLSAAAREMGVSRISRVHGALEDA